MLENDKKILKRCQFVCQSISHVINVRVNILSTFKKLDNDFFCQNYFMKFIMKLKRHAQKHERLFYTIFIKMLNWIQYHYIV